MAIDQQISDAWNKAAEDLKIRVDAPFTMYVDGEACEFEAFVPDFGSRQGAVAMSEISQRKIAGWLSILFPVYRNYDRGRFIETLEDWGWFGEGSPPDWFRGGSSAK